MDTEKALRAIQKTRGDYRIIFKEAFGPISSFTILTSGLVALGYLARHGTISFHGLFELILSSYNLVFHDSIDAIVRSIEHLFSLPDIRVNDGWKDSALLFFLYGLLLFRALKTLKKLDVKGEVDTIDRLKCNKNVKRFNSFFISPRLKVRGGIWSTLFLAIVLLGIFKDEQYIPLYFIAALVVVILFLKFIGDFADKRRQELMEDDPEVFEYAAAAYTWNANFKAIVGLHLLSIALLVLTFVILNGLSQ